MTLSTSTKIIPVVVISSVVIVMLIASAFAQTQVERTNSELIKKREAKLDLIANAVELRLQDATKILKLTATQDVVKDVLYATAVSEEFKGLPPGVDEQKRLAAQNTRAIYEDFETVAFILPNGDIYFVEPYEAQESLPRLNFAYREWYQGVIANGDAYIGEAVVSAATGHRIVPISVAVYADDEAGVPTLSGILVGALDMKGLENELRDGEIGANEYMIIADHKGTVVADSRDGSASTNILKSALYVEDISKALSGEFGSNTQMIDGSQMFVSYRSLQAGTNNWAIVSLQPEDDFLFTVNTITLQSVITIVLVLFVSSISGYLLYRAFRGNNTLTQRLEHLNEELKKVDKAKEEFSAMITHELKTPLVPIIGYSELLLDGTLGDLSQRQREKISILHESAVSLSRLIADLLDIRKLELGKLKLEKGEALAKEILESCVSAIRPLADAKNIHLSYSLDPDDVKLNCDSKRIQQVLNNLLSNATKFTPSDIGKIEVFVRKVDGNKDAKDNLLFSVKDNGLGIAKEKQINLFKKFYQVDTSLTRNIGGTGLGLAISKGIVEAHGGRIWAESEGIEGIGSTFYFSLPISTTPGQGPLADDTGITATASPNTRAGGAEKGGTN